jgi:hypothetical protein
MRRFSSLIQNVRLKFCSGVLHIVEHDSGGDQTFDWSASADVSKRSAAAVCAPKANASASQTVGDSTAETSAPVLDDPIEHGQVLSFGLFGGWCGLRA